MGRGSHAKKISQLRRDQRRAHFGLPSLYSKTPAWLVSLNSHLVGELNYQLKKEGYSWSSVGGYATCEVPLKVDCRYIAVSDDAANLVVHITYDKVSKELSLQIPGASVSLLSGESGIRINLEARVGKPKFTEEGERARLDVQSRIRPLLESILKQ